MKQMFNFNLLPTKLNFKVYIRWLIHQFLQFIQLSSHGHTLQKLMIEYILTLLLLGAVYAYYTLIHKPQKIMEKYRKLFQSKGYKVKTYPFHLLKSAGIDLPLQSLKKYGDCHHIAKIGLPGHDVSIWNALNFPVVEIISPKLLKEFYQPDSIYYYEKVPFIVANFQRVLGHGIPFSEGDEWKKRRKIMNSVFNYDFITSNIPKIVRITNTCYGNMEKEATAGDKKQIEFSCLDVHAQIMANVMLECFFGLQFSDQKINGVMVSEFINELTGDINKQTYDSISFLFGQRFLSLGLRELDRSVNERIKAFREFGFKKIHERIEKIQKSNVNDPLNQKYTDIVEALVKSKKLGGTEKLKKQVAESYNLIELVEQFMTFFIGGTDTTNHFTEMLIYNISTNPEIERKLREQVESVITKDEDITAENLKKLTYLDWIQNETTRTSGPGTGLFLRKVVKDHYLGEVPIKSDITLTLQPIGTHFDEKYYKKPFEFRPERWESQTQSNPSHAFGGFSGGPRTCIGKHLAMLESKIIVVKLLMRYKAFKIKEPKIVMNFKFLPQADPPVRIQTSLP